jgi:hypothetical protein
MNGVENDLKFRQWSQRKPNIEERKDREVWKSSRIVAALQAARETDTIEPYIQYYIERTHNG